METHMADAGNTLKGARDLGTLSADTNLKEKVGGLLDGADYYKFTIKGSQFLKITLTGLSKNADVKIYDYKGNLIEQSALIGSQSETIWQYLYKGAYYIQVSSSSGETSYNLSLDFTSKPPNLTPKIPLPFDSEYSNVQASSGWGDPHSHKNELHYGVDFVLKGQSIRNVQALSVGNNGRVIDWRDGAPDDSSGKHYSGLGNFITIAYDTEFGTYYATYMHLKNGSVTAAIQAQIGNRALTTSNISKYADFDIGELVGRVGDTGADYPHHLHFQFSDELIKFGANGLKIADGTKESSDPYRFISNKFPYTTKTNADIPDDRPEAYADYLPYASDGNNDFWFL